jgi:hypothetical protein
MVDPLYRVRENWDNLFNEADYDNFYVDAIAPDGHLVATQTGFHGRKLPWGVYSYIRDYDQANKALAGIPRERFYRNGPCFAMRTDLSGLTQDVDYEGGGNYIRWGSNGAPFSQLSREMLNALHVAEADLVTPGAFPGRVPDSLRNNLHEQAWNYFSDIFPEAISFSEFTQGLFQLKDLIPQVGETVAKTFTGGYLNKSFGWDNLGPDLDTLGNILGVVSKRLEYLYRTYGIPTRLGFSRKGCYTPDINSIGLYQPGYLANGWVVKEIQGVSLSVDYRATCWINQHLDMIHDFTGFIQVLMGALGLNNPVKAFWNTLPISFVVDWFFNISQHLDNLTRLNPPMGWDVTGVTHSFTYTYEFDVVQKDYPVAGYVQQERKRERVVSRIYDRGIGLPFGWELLNPNELSPSQLSLLAAMLHQLG